MEPIELNKIAVVLIELMSQYGAFVLYIGTFLLGENIIIIAFLLSAQGFLDFSQTIPATFFGSLSADLFWYFFGNAFLTHDKIRIFLENRGKKNGRLISFLLNQHIIVTFTFIKFLVGLRLLLTLSFVLIKKITFVRYLLLCIISNSFFILALYGLGVLASKGIDVLPMYRNFTTILLSGVVLVLLVNMTPAIVGYVMRKVRK